MFGLKKVGCVGFCLLALGFGVQPASAADDPASLVKYRKAIMKAIGGHMGALAAVAKGEVSFSDEAVGHAHAINEMSKNLLRLFPEGSDYDSVGDTDALPAVWEQWANFEAAAKAFQDESAKMAEAAKSGDAAAFGQQVGALGRNGCGNCHDTFRYKK